MKRPACAPTAASSSPLSNRCKTHCPSWNATGTRKTSAPFLSPQSREAKPFARTKCLTARILIGDSLDHEHSPWMQSDTYCSDGWFLPGRQPRGERERSRCVQSDDGKSNATFAPRECLEPLHRSDRLVDE